MQKKIIGGLTSLLLMCPVNFYWLFTLFLLANWLVEPVHASTKERIVNFDSEIVVTPNAQLRVTEKITVLAQGKQIKRGIYRDFSLTSPFSRGKVPFQVLNIQRNGEESHYWVEDRGNNKRINIYQPDVYLEPGIYTYTLTYHTSQQLDLAQGKNQQDQLFWNVTGRDWRLSIEQASAIIYLPDSIPTEMIEINAFTNKLDEKEQNYRGYIDQNGHPKFLTTAPLGLNEGLSIMVKFPTGHLATHVSSSSEPETRHDWISHFQQIIKHPKWAELVILTFLFSTLPLIIWLVWILLLLLSAMKNLSLFERTVPVHCTEPPNNLSPTAMYFVENFTPPHLMVSLWTLVTRGNLTIRRQRNQQKSLSFKPYHDNYYLEYTRYQEKTALNAISLCEADRQIFEALRWKVSKQSMEISPTNRKMFFQLNKILKKALKTEFDNLQHIYFPYRKFIASSIIFGIMTSLFFIGNLPNLAEVLLRPIDDSIPSFVGITVFILLILLIFLFKCPSHEARSLINRIAGFKRRLQTLNLDIKQKELRTDQSLERDLVYAVTFHSPRQIMRQFRDFILRTQPERKTYIPSLSIIQYEENKVTIVELSSFFDFLFEKIQETLGAPPTSTHHTSTDSSGIGSASSGGSGGGEDNSGSNGGSSGSSSGDGGGGGSGGSSGGGGGC